MTNRNLRAGGSVPCLGLSRARGLATVDVRHTSRRNRKRSWSGPCGPSAVRQSRESCPRPTCCGAPAGVTWPYSHGWTRSPWPPARVPDIRSSRAAVCTWWRSSVTSRPRILRHRRGLRSLPVPRPSQRSSLRAERRQAPGGVRNRAGSPRSARWAVDSPPLMMRSLSRHESRGALPFPSYRWVMAADQMCARVTASAQSPLRLRSASTSSEWLLIDRRNRMGS